MNAGHQVTTFNRGTHLLAEQNDVERIVGDRALDLAVLKSRDWDAVIDTCGYDGTDVRASVELLRAVVVCYVFVSSISVYADFSAIGVHEESPLRSRSNNEPDYGAQKAECERVVLDAMPANSLIVRPGLIAGPFDASDRFTYWPTRIANGGTILAPGNPDRRLQFIDARDLSDWILRLIENDTTGIFNATGPSSILTMGTFLDLCKVVAGSDASFHWVDNEILTDFGLTPWSELPLWIPESDQESRGFMSVDIKRALECGLQFRPLATTIRDTLHWDSERDVTSERKAGLSADREKRLLKKKS